MCAPLIAPLTLALACTPATERAEGLPPEAAYVWQRSWTPAVEEAVRRQAPGLDGLLLLAAEISWQGSTAQIHQVQPTLVPRRAGWVVRVAVPPPGVDPLEVLAPLFGALAQAHPDALELQLDLDVPTRRLAEHARWVAQLEALIEPVPLTVTTLPTWLSSPAFPELISAADGYVLQLHWIHPGDPGQLLDPDALEHTERAARLQRPLSVALPTYGYQLVTGPDSSLLGLSAEQGHASAPKGGSVTRLRADPARVAGLLRSWSRDRPAALSRILWFRLPTGQDQHAWSAQTLATVRAGRIPRPQPRLQLRSEPGGSLTLILHNDGDDDLPLPRIEVGARALLADGLGAWRWSAPEHSFLPAPARALRPGRSQLVGWLRSETIPTVTLHGPPQ